MLITVAVSSFILSLLILILIRGYLIRGALFSGDTFFHLLISKAIKTNKWKFPSSIKNVDFFESDDRYNYLTYPPLLHYIIAIFPVKLHLTVAKYLNIVIFSLIATLAAVVTYSLTLTFISALLSSLIVIFNLSAFDLISQLSPRPLGILLYSLIVCIAVFYPLNLLSLLCISILVALTCLAHKFAVQTLLLSFIPYVLIFNKPILIIFISLGFLLSIIISRGFYLKILREHIHWLRFYNFKRNINLTADLSSILVRNTWYLQLLVIMVLSIFIPRIVLSNNLGFELIFWSFINLFIALVVMHPSLKLIGEHYRYIEYGLVSVGISIGVLSVHFNVIFLIFGLICFFLSIMALLKLKSYLINSKMLITKEDIQIYNSLKDSYKDRLLVIPSIRTLEVNYFTGLNTVHLVRGHAVIDSIGTIIDKYKIRYILKFKNIDTYGMFEKISTIRHVNKIRDFSNFEIYEISE